jgi:hypothetical protein
MRWPTRISKLTLVTFACVLDDSLQQPWQHDPDDEPVAPPLEPEFFEFDREYLGDVLHSIL